MTSISWSFWSESKLWEKLLRGTCPSLVHPSQCQPKLFTPPSPQPCSWGEVSMLYGPPSLSVPNKGPATWAYALHLNGS